MEIRVRRGDFSGGPVVKNPPFEAEDMGSVSGWGTKIPCVTWPKTKKIKKKKKKENYHPWLCVSK